MKLIRRAHPKEFQKNTILQFLGIQYQKVDRIIIFQLVTFKNQTQFCLK